MTTNRRLKGQTIVITGASAGLGEQIAYEAATQGATVILGARRMAQLEQVKTVSEALSGTTAYAFEVDVADGESIDHFVEQIDATGRSVDVLINCAGFGLFEDFVATEWETIESMFQVNVLGLLYLTQKLALPMIQQEAGHIINIASSAGKIATPKAAVYTATKFAVIGFSNALRLELKPANVRVTTVNPGPIATEFFDKADASGNYLEKVDWLTLNPTQVAQKVVRAIGTNKRELNLPWFLEVAARAYAVAPRVGDWLAGSVFNKK